MRPADVELEQAIFRALRKAILFAVAIYLLFQFLGAVTALVLFFGLVFLLAAVLNPVVAWLERYRIPRPVSATAFGLLILGGAVATIWFGTAPLLDQGRELVRLAPQLWGDLSERLQRLLARNPQLQAQVPTWQVLLERISTYGPYFAGRIGQYTISFLGLMASLVLLVILVVYSLAHPMPLVAGLLGAFPERHRPLAQHILGLILSRLKEWALGSLLLGLIIGVIVAVGLSVLGVPFALVFGVIAAFGEMLPTVGPLLSAVPPLLVALAMHPTLALWVGMLFLVAQQLENYLIVPLVMGRALDLHPLSIAFMMLVMGALFGLLGAILAVPTAVIVKTLYQELYLSRYVSDPAALEAQSQRVISDEIAVEAEAEAHAALHSAAPGRTRAG